MPAVLAHCFLGNGASWAPMVGALPVPVDALAFDMPGHGRSPMPEDPGDFHAAVTAVIGGLVTQPSLLVGHSFGGAAMLRHALQYPSTAIGLVLIEPVLFAAARDEPEFPPYRASEQALRDAVQAGRSVDAARRFLAMNPGSPDFDALPASVQAVMAAQMRLLIAAEAGIFGDSGGLLTSGMMERFDVPVLLLLGGETAPIFRAVVRVLAGRLPRAEIAVIDGAGHMVPISHPRETATVIHDWMQRSGLLAAPAQTPRVG